MRIVFLPGYEHSNRPIALTSVFKVILYSYLISKKMNERITDSYTNIHNERIKTKYIPSYIFENEGKIFKKRTLPKLNEFPENLRCSNINGAMHKLLVGECLTGAKSVR